MLGPEACAGRSQGDPGSRFYPPGGGVGLAAGGCWVTALGEETAGPEAPHPACPPRSVLPHKILTRSRRCERRRRETGRAGRGGVGAGGELVPGPSTRAEAARGRRPHPGLRAPGSASRLRGARDPSGPTTVASRGEAPGRGRLGWRRGSVWNLRTPAGGLARGGGSPCPAPPLRLGRGVRKS